ncbi:MAG: hypothetical protein KME29_14725 [Calothrix sp. FI2-JRJ7]|jgi:hypothetical protein|nr:hypothetical protein [Calothrix sp. FI2-JRJ7]
MSGGWLCWHNKQLILAENNGQVRICVNEQMPENQTDEIGFAVGKSWQLALPGEQQPQLFISLDGIMWQSLPPAPLQGSKKDAAVRLHPNYNLLSIIEPRFFHFYKFGETWQTLPLPDGAIWVDAGADSEWWAVGSQPATRVQNANQEVAAWRKSAFDEIWVPISIRTSWWEAYHTISNGGFEKLRAVNAQQQPVVFASECAWFLEDPSWFLFTSKPTGEFAIQRLLDRSLARIERDVQGQPIAVTTDGELWDWNGSKWKPRNSAKALCNTLGYSQNIGNYRVHLALARNEIYGVVTNYSNNIYNKNIAVYSMDSGRSWQIAKLNELSKQRTIAGWAI